MRSLSQLTVGPQGLAFDPASGHSFVLNPSGTILLQALQGGSDTVGAVRLLSEKYALRKEDAERDVTDFMSCLRTLGLI
ncbi:MAG TPA: PqqD family protein [Pirellulales bacterium]|jgi:hypothetical protein|nr:PqqD family protein [Pirellulales bacterium]